MTTAPVRGCLRWALVILYLVAAWFHLTAPVPFLRIMPAFVPWPEQVVTLTGIAEGLGAVALAQGCSLRLQRTGAIGLALYAVGVFPANINHFAMDMARPGIGWGLAYHIPRMIAQPLLVWLALWTGCVTEWPVRRRS